jgi:hypothetical protein
MTRETWLRDLRNVDDAVMRSGEALRDDPKDTLLWRIVYVLAVAVWHLLEDKVRGLVSRTK